MYFVDHATTNHFGPAVVSIKKAQQAQ